MIGVFIRQERMLQNISQAGLCEGICSVSYLSKIESNTVDASLDLLKDLLEVLGVDYNSDPLSNQKFLDLFDETLYQLSVEDFDAFNRDEIETNALEFRASQQMIESYLLSGFLLTLNSFDKRDDLKGIINVLESISFSFNLRQRLYFDYLWCSYYSQFKENISEVIKRLEMQLPYEKEGFCYTLLCDILMRVGDYSRGIDMALKGYDFFVEQGNLAKMVRMSFVLMMNYSNVNDFERMKFYYQRTMNLNRYLKDETYEIFGSYNLGATYLQQKHYPEAYLHLQKAYQHYIEVYSSDLSQVNLILQKLVFCCCRTGQFEEAQAYFKLIQETQNPTFLKSISLMEFMLEHHHPETSLTYIDLLKECVQSTLDHEPMGFTIFYVRLLIDAYREHRQYKKMVDLMEKFNIS